MISRLSRRAVALVCLCLCVLFMVTCPVVADPDSIPSWHFGEHIPITFYIRLKRQVSSGVSALWGGTEAPVMDGTDATPLENLLVDDSADGLRAVMKGKHEHQLMRSLPSSYAPRFGIDRIVRMPANQLLIVARKQLEQSLAVSESEVAVRLSLGRGLSKETVWIPVAVRMAALPNLREIIGPLAADRIEKARREASRESKTTEDDAIHSLSSVLYKFGFQQGEMNKITSCSVTVQYSGTPVTEIEMMYEWDEHRAYNPSRALTLCSLVAVLIAMVMSFVVMGGNSKANRQFRKKMVAVRLHED